VRGKLKPLWFKPFEAYILQRVQIIAENETLYISTANGLYALDAGSGQEKWVYPTELPLGHSPTISKGIAYVGGFDHKLHAINARTGRGVWQFEAGAGFDTNPLVVNDKVYAGNRDGNFYAIYTEGSDAGQIAWKFKTGGPIHFSAAYAQGVVYFASNDSYAYALNAETGSLVWKSQKLPGSGFHSWWPVIYRDWVVLLGAIITVWGRPGSGLHDQDEEYVYPNRKDDERHVRWPRRQ
jgi:outer membrane protein assembly factor BamB